MIGLVVYRFSGSILVLMRGTKRKICMDRETEKKVHQEVIVSCIHHSVLLTHDLHTAVMDGT